MSSMYPSLVTCIHRQDTEKHFLPSKLQNGFGKQNTMSGGVWLYLPTYFCSTGFFFFFFFNSNCIIPLLVSVVTSLITTLLKLWRYMSFLETKIDRRRYSAEKRASNILKKKKTTKITIKKQERKERKKKKRK